MKLNAVARRVLVSVITVLLVLGFFQAVHVGEASGGPVRLRVREEPYIPGKPEGTFFFVSIDIESPFEWDLTLGGVVGWTFDVNVDPDVLSPCGVYGAALGYFLFDFVDWNGLGGQHNPVLLVGEVNETHGFIRDISEFVMDYEGLGIGAGGNSSDPFWYGLDNGLVKLRFRSESETAYSPIRITDAAYWTADGVKHVIPDEDIIDGHYNMHEWVPYVPDSGQIQLEYWNENGTSYTNVSIEFPSSGYSVSNWGTPVILGNTISADAEIWDWAEADSPVITVKSHTYNLGNLSVEEYVFIFKAWGSPIRDTTFFVPEFPSVLILPLFMITTLVALMLYKRKRSM